MKGRSLFRHSGDTIAAVDALKDKILYFDNELNYKDEVSIAPPILNVLKDEGIVYATGNFANTGNYLALLDENYNVLKTFEKRRVEPKYGWIHTNSLSKGYLMLGKEIGTTAWAYLEPDSTQIRVLDAETQKTKVTLKWPLPHLPSENEIQKTLNIHSCYYVRSHGPYYVVQMSFNETVKSPTLQNLYIFKKQDGTLLASFQQVGFTLMSTYEKNGKQIYFLDEDGNVKYIEIEELLK